MKINILTLPDGNCPQRGGSRAGRKETPAENWRKRWDAKNPPLSSAAIAALKFPPGGQIRHHPASRTQSPRCQLKIRAH